MPGLAELREWLEREIDEFGFDLEELLSHVAEGKPTDWRSGYACALMKVKGKVEDLESLDSSHDLPSTKG